MNSYKALNVYMGGQKVGTLATMVNGNGRNPGMNDLLAVAGAIKFDNNKAKMIAKEIQEIVQSDLRLYIKG